LTPAPDLGKGAVYVSGASQDHRRRADLDKPRKVEQHDPDGERFITGHAQPKLIETGQQKTGLARFLNPKLISSHQPPRSATQERCTPKRLQL
jgi:hypothetical protein